MGGKGLMGCFWDSERYFELLKEAKVRGYLFEQRNYVPGGEGSGV